MGAGIRVVQEVYLEETARRTLQVYEEAYVLAQDQATEVGRDP